MWRMDKLSATWLLVLACALLLPNVNKVKCDDDDTPSPPPGDVDAPPADAADAGDATDAGDAADAGDAGDAGDAADTGDAGDATDAGDAADAANAGATPSSETGAGDIQDRSVAEVASAPIAPEVKCVGKEDITESKAVKASVTTSTCEQTKDQIEALAASWCSKEPCKLNVFQDGTLMFLESEDASMDALASALQSEGMKNQLGVTDVKYTSSSGSSVFAGILVTGLLAAVALTVGYFKCQRRPSPKGERLAEEGTPADQQNQANTLASDAPLNPPPETPEKPSANGEAPEGDKTPPPPTNGHPAPATTADTEL